MADNRMGAYRSPWVLLGVWGATEGVFSMEEQLGRITCSCSPSNIYISLFMWWLPLLFQPHLTFLLITTQPSSHLSPSIYLDLSTINSPTGQISVGLKSVTATPSDISSHRPTGEKWMEKGETEEDWQTKTKQGETVRERERPTKRENERLHATLWWAFLMKKLRGTCWSWRPPPVAMTESLSLIWHQLSSHWATNGMATRYCWLPEGLHSILSFPKGEQIPHYNSTFNSMVPFFLLFPPSTSTLLSVCVYICTSIDR